MAIRLLQQLVDPEIKTKLSALIRHLDRYALGEINTNRIVRKVALQIYLYTSVNTPIMWANVLNYPSVVGRYSSL